MHPANKWLMGLVPAALVAGAVLWEGDVRKPYYDVAGVPTVCSGYTGKDIEMNKTYSQGECTAFLKKELVEHSSGVLACINKPLKENEFNAFSLMAYNVGVAGFCGSRSARLFNQGFSMQACDAMAYGPNGEKVWAYAGGKYYRGLHNRRLYERAMCKGVPYVPTP